MRFEQGPQTYNKGLITITLPYWGMLRRAILVYKTKDPSCAGPFDLSTLDAIRTHDLLLRRQLLYPAELPGLNYLIFNFLAPVGISALFGLVASQPQLSYVAYRLLHRRGSSPHRFRTGSRI